eukprot:1656895-Rhodomonas_salina.2
MSQGVHERPPAGPENPALHKHDPRSQTHVPSLDIIGQLDRTFSGRERHQKTTANEKSCLCILREIGMLHQ